MKVSVTVDEKVVIKYEGKINMSQSVVLSKEDAKKLGEILSSGNTDYFESE